MGENAAVCILVRSSVDGGIPERDGGLCLCISSFVLKTGFVRVSAEGLL